MLKDRQGKLTISGANLDHALRMMTDREQLIVHCLLARDLFHIARSTNASFARTRWPR